MEPIHDSTCLQRARRIPYRIKVVLHRTQSDARVEGEVCDLSMGGMFIETNLPLRPNSVFEVEIPMQPQSYRGRVKVLWMRPSEEGADRYGLAVEWVGLTGQQKNVLFRKINDYVRAGGDLLVGTPEVDSMQRPLAGEPATSTAVASDYTRLIVGLSIGVAVMAVVLILLL